MSSLFLPFTDDGKRAELTAISVKERLGVAVRVPVDPYAVLSRVPAALVSPDELTKHDPARARRLLQEAKAAWSGIGFGVSPASGNHLILLNPSHAETRQRVTLMEELVHIVLGHPRVDLSACRGPEAWKRPFHADVESEAFEVAAACLIPYPLLFEAVSRDHKSASDVARAFRVSEQYAIFRINRAGLSRVYGKRQRRAAG